MNIDWTEDQKMAIIRIISFTAFSMNDDERGDALALIHRITFNSKDKLNAMMDDIRVYVSDETLIRFNEEN